MKSTKLMKAELSGLRLATVCEEAQCPNIGEVLEWPNRHRHGYAARRHVHARLPILRRQHEPGAGASG